MKKVIVVGATSGIGRGLAQMLAAKGYRTGITGRRQALLKELKLKNPDAFVLRCFDVSDVTTAIENLERMVEELGGMDLLVLSAGTGELNPDLDFGVEKSTIDTNVTGFTALADWAYGYFDKHGGGHLAAVSSVGGLRGSKEAPAYNATKAYQINYLEGLRQKAAKNASNITVTDIRPGLVDTAMAKGEGLFWVMPTDKAVRQIYKGIARKRKVLYVTRRWGILARLLKVIPRTLYERM
ncbi:MAG: SDR family NAD(P)-dependent oxidoreductase [Bacteroidales bacterium]|nr:SDR family NAD(P)-dependent oxidoreductase [Bacteroidales bacterium]